MPKPTSKNLIKDKKNTDKSFFDKFALSDTLILAAIPFAAYAIVYFFERGYFSVFNIPLEFISFDLTRIFLALLSLILFASIVYYLSEILFNVFGSQPDPVKRRLYNEIYPFVFAITLVFLLLQIGKHLQLLHCLFSYCLHQFHF